MNATRHTAVVADNEQETTMRITSSKLIRCAGLAALVAGLIFAGIQPIHPADVVASVTTRAWSIITPLKTAMCLLFLLGITGLYARQAKQSGWLGLAGYLLLSLSWALQTAFVFAEAFILPTLATTAPKFVDGMLGMSSGRASAVGLGALPTLYSLVGFSYILGGLVFGVASLRARILPRWAAGLLAVAAVVTPVTSMVPHQIGRLAAIPTALAFAWLGYALLTERAGRVASPQAVPSGMSAQLRHAAAE